LVDSNISFRKYAVTNYVAAFFLLLTSQNAFCFDISQSLNIRFNDLEPLEEIQSKTFFKSIKDVRLIEPAIKATFKDLGFTFISESQGYEKKFSSCIYKDKKSDECIVSGKLFFLSSSSYSSFNLIFTSGKNNVTTPELYAEFYKQLDKNLSQ
jgi:hypothetical protein